MADGLITESKNIEPREAAAAEGHRTAVELPRFSVDRTFAALKYPNYRLWFMGQLASLVGTWMQSTAQGFLIYQPTNNSPAYLGYVAFAAGLPTWLFMLYAGVVADRMSRRTLLVLTQTVMMILAFALAALTFLNLVQPWHIIVLAFLLGVANSFDAPARQAFVLEMVDRQELSNAIALNSTMFQAATIVGPAVAGITYALLGPAWCFVVNGISFIAVIVALLAMKLKPFAVTRQATSALHDLAEGLRYTLTHSVIRTLIAIIAVASLFGLAFATLFPAWAVTVLNGDASTHGYLQSARGLGALIGALMIASLGHFRAKGKLLTLGTFALPIALVLFSFTNTLLTSLLMLVAAGWAFMLLANMANTLVQTEVTDELRGRVMAVYSLVFFGFMPVGGLAAGLAAQYWGPPVAVAIAGAATLAFAIAVYLFLPRVRALE